MKFVKLKEDGNATKLKVVFGIRIEVFMIVYQILQLVLKLVETAWFEELKFVMTTTQ